MPERKNIDRKLLELDEIKLKISKLQETEQRIKNQIRKMMKQSVVCFVDMDESSRAKIRLEKQPEEWIYQVKSFCDVVAHYMEGFGGEPLKFLGDGVLGSFQGPECFLSAEKLAESVEEIRRDVESKAKVKTGLKMSIDFGQVYFLNYEGHNPPDPQGTCVDRCARLLTIATSGSVLASEDFVSQLQDRSRWGGPLFRQLRNIGPSVMWQIDNAAPKLRSNISIVRLDRGQRISLDERLKSVKRTRKTSNCVTIHFQKSGHYKVESTRPNLRRHEKGIRKKVNSVILENSECINWFTATGYVEITARDEELIVESSGTKIWVRGRK